MRMDHDKGEGPQPDGMVFHKTLQKGVHKGLETLWTLTKMIVPVYFLVTALKYTPVLKWISDGFSPFMTYLGLPGEAAIVLVLGGVLNIYAAIGAMASLSLTIPQTTVLAVMISFAHNLFVETAVTKGVGVSIRLIAGFRILLALIGGLLVNALM